MELTTDRIRQLDAAASASDFPERDRAVLHAALYWGFTATELSLLPLQAVMHRNGDWQTRFKVPATFAFNGETRTAWLLDAGFIAILEDYIAFRHTQEWCPGKPDRYRGLAPREPLFLNNRGLAFSMTPRSPGADDLLPTGMNRLLRELLDAAGLEEHSPLDFRDTTIVRLWDAGLTRQDIMTLTGIRRSETINRKIRDRIPPVEDVFSHFHRDLHAG
jgi:integrase